MLLTDDISEKSLRIIPVPTMVSHGNGNQGLLNMQRVRAVKVVRVVKLVKVVKVVKGSRDRRGTQSFLVLWVEEERSLSFGSG